MPRYEGRLELTWTNKHEQLLAHEDGSYEWLPPADYRVAEVRLLDDVETVGDVGRRRAGDNLLIRGDALHVLRSLTKLPEFSHEYAGNVKLAYLDPPFNTGQAFEHYDDALEHSVWLTMMRDRLVQIQKMLSAEGSIWVECDDAEQHQLRSVMDEVFGPTNFVATVLWERRFSRSNDALISVSHDYIIVYAKDRRQVRLFGQPSSDEQRARYRNPDGDMRGDWISVSFNAPNLRPNLTYPIAGPTGKVHLPPAGRCWSTTRQEYERLLEDDRIYFGAAGGGVPRLKKFWSESVVVLTPSTWWPHEEVGSNQESVREMQGLFPTEPTFGTPKPERLLNRIIQIATLPGDVVLDCFVGSGTTAAVAQKMGRRWVAVEREERTVHTYALPRLRKVVSGDDLGGVTLTTDWTGGGGFRVLSVAPSIFEADERGLVLLADSMTDGQLAEATAAQLGYYYQPEPPFVGRKGRARLAVVDGVVNEGVVRLLVSALDTEERIVICGTGIDPEARPLLRDLREGSTLRKIPAALLDRYRAPRRRNSKVSLTDKEKKG